MHPAGWGEAGWVALLAGLWMGGICVRQGKAEGQVLRVVPARPHPVVQQQRGGAAVRGVDGIVGIWCAGEHLDRLAVPGHKAARAGLAQRAQPAPRGRVAAQRNDRQGGLASGDAAAGVGGQLLGQAGAAADGMGEGHVAAARHPLSLPLPAGDEPALLVAAQARRRPRGALALAQLQLLLGIFCNGRS